MYFTNLDYSDNGAYELVRKGDENFTATCYVIEHYGIKRKGSQ